MVLGVIWIDVPVDGATVADVVTKDATTSAAKVERDAHAPLRMWPQARVRSWARPSRRR
jgi:hypothetical protein